MMRVSSIKKSLYQPSKLRNSQEPDVSLQDAAAQDCLYVTPMNHPCWILMEEKSSAGFIEINQKLMLFS